MRSLLWSLVLAAAPSAPNPKDVEIAVTRGAVEIRSLTLLGAGADDTGSWEVYAPPHEKCTEPAVSKARLAKAKAAFAQVHMRMDKDIEPTATPNAKGEMSLKVGERTVVLATRETDEIRFAEDPPEKYKALDCDPVTGDRVHTLTFLADGEQLHESVRVYPGASAGRVEVEVLGAFSRGAKVLILQMLTTDVGMAGPSVSASDLRLSPVLDLAP